MDVKKGKMLFLLLAFGAFHLTGCTAHVSPHVSEAEFMFPGPKVPGRSTLYVSEEFRTYMRTKTDVMDLKKWEFELGPVAVDAFKYALAGRFKDAEVRLGTPGFPLEGEDNQDVLVVVQPAFENFKAHAPFFFKFETYKVTVSFRVKVFDKAGNVLVDDVYEGVGKKRGSIGYESAGHAAAPVAAQMAVEEAVNKAVADIVRTVNR